MKKVYRVAASQEEATILKATNSKTRQIMSFFPADRHDCECQPVIKDLALQFSQMPPNQVRSTKEKLGGIYNCPANLKKGLKKFEVTCKNCGALLAKCFASDKTLSDWVDLHYISTSEWTKDGTFWQGALTVNISPIDGKLGFECACGEDTRDFRGKNDLTKEDRDKRVKDAMVGRDLGKSDSRFQVKEIS